MNFKGTKSAKFAKELVTNKDKDNENQDRCYTEIEKAALDLGLSVNWMPYDISNRRDSAIDYFGSTTLLGESTERLSGSSDSMLIN